MKKETCSALSMKPTQKTLFNSPITQPAACISPWLEYNRNKQEGNVAGTQVAAQFNQNLDAKFEGIKTIAIVAHGNSLRAFLRTMEIETAESIPGVEFDTGVPEVLEFDQSGNYLKRYKLELVTEPAPEPAQAAIN